MFHVNGILCILLNPVPMPGIGPINFLVLMCLTLVVASAAVGAALIIRSVRRKKK